MPVVNPGEVWLVDFGLAAKVRPALLLTGNPAVEELDLVTGSQGKDQICGDCSWWPRYWQVTYCIEPAR